MELAVCDVCPRECRLAEGAWGFCEIRAAHRGHVQDMYYSAIAWPGVRGRFGSDIPWGFSAMRNRKLVEAYLPGCNLKCDFCIGPFLSKVGEIRGIRWIDPNDLVRAATGLTDLVGFSGGEPSIHVEYVTDVFSKFHEKGMRTSLESNGYMTATTAQKLAERTDCIGIGLKASLDPTFYKQKFGAETEPIRQAVKIFAKSGCEVILTNLTDPYLWNDKQAFENLTAWIVRELGAQTRLVLSSFEKEDRTHVTPPEQRQAYLQEYKSLATEAGLQQVFFQVDVKKRLEEHREQLERTGLFSALEQLGMRPSEQQW
jgi:pyruvate formate lyase activating enzyme